jgi:hypothetical protein
METRHINRRRLDVLAMVLLAALAFRAYVPVGFMPASGAPFLVELCPAYDGALRAEHLHHHHSQSHADFQNCPFGSAPAQGPATHLVAFEPPGRIPSLITTLAQPQRISTQLLRIQQPRGPPSPV